MRKQPHPHKNRACQIDRLCSLLIPTLFLRTLFWSDFSRRCFPAQNCLRRRGPFVRNSHRAVSRFAFASQSTCQRDYGRTREDLRPRREDRSARRATGSAVPGDQSLVGRIEGCGCERPLPHRGVEQVVRVAEEVHEIAGFCGVHKKTKHDK